MKQAAQLPVCFPLFGRKKLRLNLNTSKEMTAGIQNSMGENQASIRPK
ncbi:MAG: hypothetical protein ACI898_000426 [Flavobacteriales bacterium]|jgi:hypothetical protein